MAADSSQRTEKPTPKHTREARREGRVARSTEIGSWFSLGAIILILPDLGHRAVSLITGYMALASNAMSSDDPAESIALLGRGLWTAVEAAGPILLAASLAGTFASYAQVGLRVAPGAIGFKWSKVSPVTGFKRIFSPSGVWELAKSVLRLLVLIGIGYFIDKGLISTLLGGGTLPLEATLSIVGSGVMGLIRDVAVIAFLLAIGDYAFQRRKFNESMKMTKDEVRRELRETDANPEIRKALRRRRRRMSRAALLAGLKDADMVVVNPTHFSVGLRYDAAKDRAPRVVTKGDDADALAIRIEARKLGIPVIENPPVARSLFDLCEIGDEVPVELYQTIARLLAFVYRLSPVAKTLVDVHRMAA